MEQYPIRIMAATESAASLAAAGSTVHWYLCSGLFRVRISSAQTCAAEKYSPDSSSAVPSHGSGKYSGPFSGLRKYRYVSSRLPLVMDVCSPNPA